MERTHVYIVNESEIKISPTLYKGYISRYGKVVFDLKPETFDILKSAWNKYRDVMNSDEVMNESKMEEIITEYSMNDNDAVFGVFSFMIVAANNQDQINVDKSDPSKVRFTLTK